ncbi:MAG: Stp1/IreP family PP2C-type Ser/Thr phosphatase [Lactobacillus sp.]|nr:Stp1/IreP family PP2C-type Ser/Thr phosphatase [Lactobacillus sp.]MCH3906114.1 Stp1/IreP family PP2C-type Ser/Thr phosphatase [Lactobacillus sp.]MCH3990308.1 Stp1/IreP family PP2C-type Ser/Thr phosphatase [Lactobacillus sp.]MCH4068977.1 Stp1/IreP family PP2C-type Ser/Thr phosphatase [Lactobacillus sp.]MCI1303379.1 Stp1/IreP family PP2C-type Ser/Thr phosphatase [Lactobacillus sp.]
MIQTAYSSSIGRVRKTNQDFVRVFKNKKQVTMAIVCDGMGGHQGGDVASTMAVTHLGHHFGQTDFTNSQAAKSWLEVQLKLENATLLAAGDRFSDLNGMGTTVVVLMAFDNEVLVAHLGDSRAYSYIDGEFKQLTEDQSLVNELVKMGQITKEQARTHPQKNIITETLGVSSSINPEYDTVAAKRGSLFLLCTDGLTNSLADEQIQQILATKSYSLSEKCHRLITEANRLGGDDNITVCLLSYTAKDVKPSDH